MSEETNHDLKAKVNPLEVGTQGTMPSSEGSPIGAPKASIPKAPPKPKSEAKKPSPQGIVPVRQAAPIKEEDLFPSEEGDEDAVEPLFDDDDEDEEHDRDVAPNGVLVATDTSERIILVVDEEGQRRNETVAIICQILPNAEIEVADDPEEALEMMGEGDFDTYVVNFLMPGYSSSPFVKAVANHPEHPLLIGFAADKMSDAVDPKKGLKIIPLKRLFDLDTANSVEPPESSEE